MALLELIDLCKAFEAPAVSHIDLKLEQGRILSLLGPSGCGKTTLLRLVAGLERPDEGRVLLAGEDITDRQSHLRQIGMMFQEFALFPHKSVFDNVAFGLQMQQLPRAQVVKQTEEMLSLVGLSAFAGRNVADLSGGERQRVALARSLAPRPKLLMLDEPLGSLDRALRERLLADIHAILRELNMTAVFVTHDQTEALTVGDRVAVMHQGRFLQLDTPENVYLHPKTVFVAQFLGYKNLLSGTIAEDGGVDTALGTWYPTLAGLSPKQPVKVIIPFDGVRFGGKEPADDRQRILSGNIVSRVFTGQNYRIKIAVGRGLTLSGDLSSRQPPPHAGEDIRVWLDPQKMIVISDME